MNILTQLAKYLFIVLMLSFALQDVFYLFKRTEEKKKKVFGSQIRIIYATAILGFSILFLNTWSYRIAVLAGGIAVYYAVTVICFRLIYPRCSHLLVNNMLMLLTVGFIMIARIDEDEAYKQFIIAAGSTVIAFIIPVIIRKLKFLQKLKWFYAAIGIAALLGVLALAKMSGGARLSLSIGGISFQFSEIVKITLVFYLAAELSGRVTFRKVAAATVTAAIHVGLLVLSTDLGTALVFFMAYIVIVYVASRKPVYPLLGLAGGSAAAVAAYHLFSHVEQRVTAWKDPFAVYDTSGYQIVQGLFAIGAGGWFGVGLCQGKPNTIPVATKDFIFAAICEEFGAIFCIALLMECMCMYLLIINICVRIRNRFYKLVSIGLGTEYAIQVFLTVGGVTRLIPMTGITLPLVSYGGSSVASTIIMLAIIQGLYILREDEGEERTDLRGEVENEFEEET